MKKNLKRICVSTLATIVLLSSSTMVFAEDAIDNSNVTDEPAYSDATNDSTSSNVSDVPASSDTANDPESFNVTDEPASSDVLTEEQDINVTEEITPRTDGVAMGTHTVDDPNKYTGDWADTMGELRRADDGTVLLGTFGGNFVKSGNGGQVRAYADGALGLGKESFVSSGSGTTVWSGGPHTKKVVYTEYTSLKNNSATFKGAIWYKY